MRSGHGLQAEAALEDSPVVDDGTGDNDTSGSISDTDVDSSRSSSEEGVSEASPAEMSSGSTTPDEQHTAGTAGMGTATATDTRVPGEGGGEGPPSYLEARRLFELGILADPAHGPLYNAYG